MDVFCFCNTGLKVGAAFTRRILNFFSTFYTAQNDTIPYAYWNT